MITTITMITKIQKNYIWPYDEPYLLPFVIVFVFGAYHNCICIYCLTYLYAGHSIASPQKLSYGHNL